MTTATQEATEVVLKRADLEDALLKANERNDEVVAKMQAEIDEAKTASVESKNELTKAIQDVITANTKLSDVGERIRLLEQREATQEDAGPETLGAQFIKSDGYAAFAEGRQDKARMDLKTAIINTFPASSVQPLVQGDRQVGIHATPNRRLTLRDLLQSVPTSSNLVEFTREGTFTNNAGPQRDTASPMAAIENQTKPESALTFTLQTTPVVTLAHWIPLSKQVVADSPQLLAYVNGRLIFGLKLKEETQMLSGLGTGGELPGIQTNATAYTPESPQLTNEIDIIRDAITQAQVAEYAPNFIVLNPNDWADIQRRKRGSSDDAYVYGNPFESWLATPLWGLTPVVTNSQTSGTFLLGDTNGAMVFDREQASIEMSNSNGTDFVKNMVTVLAEERLAMATFRTEAFITGSL